jgi:hypothetical protein
MVDFWRRAVGIVFKHYWTHLQISLEELKAIFQHDLRRPFGLEALVKELIARGELVDVDQLRSLADYKAKTQHSWRGWLFAKVSSLLSERRAFSGVVALAAKLQNTSTRVEEWVKQQSKFSVVRKEDLTRYLSTLVSSKQGLDQADLDLVLLKMYCDDTALTLQREMGSFRVELVKVRTNDSLEVTESDQAFILLTVTIDQIETKLQEHEHVKEKYLAEARTWISRKQRDKAKRALLRGRLVDSYIDQLHNRRHECEAQVLELSAAEANSSVIGSLKLANEAFKLTQVSVEQAQQLREQLEEAHDLQAEVSSVLSAPIGEDDDEALLRELDQLSHEQDTQQAVEALDVPRGVPSKPVRVPSVRPFQVEPQVELV